MLPFDSDCEMGKSFHIKCITCWHHYTLSFKQNTYSTCIVVANWAFTCKILIGSEYVSISFLLGIFFFFWVLFDETSANIRMLRMSLTLMSRFFRVSVKKSLVNNKPRGIINTHNLTFSPRKNGICFQSEIDKF